MVIIILFVRIILAIKFEPVCFRSGEAKNWAKLGVLQRLPNNIFAELDNCQVARRVRGMDAPSQRENLFNFNLDPNPIPYALYLTP